ncbi:MAG: sulfotransferase domain-containing protein [Patescibacteria group bacterium]
MSLIKDIICSCGKKNCNFLNKIYNLIRKKHTTRPLLKAWQIIDKRHWPNKKITYDSIIPNQKTKINNNALNYWLKQCKSSLEKTIDAYKIISLKDIFIDNTKLYNIGEQLSRDKNWGIIVLLRNPMEIMGAYKNAGIRKKDLRSAESVLPFYYNFLQSVKQIENKKNVIIIRYEDLCDNTERVIKTICEFIGVNYQKIW